MRELSEQEIKLVSGGWECTLAQVGLGMAHVSVGAAMLTGGPAAWITAGVGWALSATSASRACGGAINDFTIVDAYGCHRISS